MAAAGGEGKASFLELVRYADARDRCLMALGALGSFGDGMMQPLSMLVLGDIVNSYGGAGAAGSGFSSGAVDKFALRLLYVAVAVGACAFLEGLCWTLTAERQASRMRRLYLEAVLRQQVEFFDAPAPSSQATTFCVISTISDDADTIQDFLAEKVVDGPYSAVQHACEMRHTRSSCRQR
ncbi:putative multidrug resistance protein [Panicum miliaceum]|uniref:Multidrug resistance protein n=1 Tax=Panicum miliaceum TaxID=4540 RepID=A0A3L6PVR8_PANMI|nr:putative multidrug resistance protein [Panicum miliaceum]